MQQCHLNSLGRPRKSAGRQHTRSTCDTTQPRASSQAPTPSPTAARFPYRHACGMSDQVASTLKSVRRGRGSEGCRSSSSRSLHHWDGWAASYSSCQFHHAYGGVWG
jgi:hypothetical protein